MVLVFGRDGCAWCPTVKKYLSLKKVDYKELPAEGPVYEEFATKFGFSVPLVVNGRKGMTGYNIPQLNELLNGKV